ncbi:MAG: D-hexose-6-phosphate mutarotase [Neptuniibacter sp.]
MDIQQQIKQLLDKFGSPSGIEFNQYNELLAVDIKNDSAEATIFLQGSQVTKYQPKGQVPVLWLSEFCDYKKGSPLRGGIPICWPWFSEFDRNPAAVKEQYSGPQTGHGFVRKLHWVLDSIHFPNEAITVLNLSLNITPNNDFPFTVRLGLSVTVGPSLEIEFRVLNKSSTNFCFTSALHSYFTISDSANASVAGLEGIDYLDTLDNWKKKSDADGFEFNAEVDRVYQNIPGEVRILDSTHDRSIVITNTNSPDIVIWNPWAEKAKRLGQFGDQEYKGMLCLENANLLENYCHLAPGEEYKTIINIKSLPGVR